MSLVVAPTFQRTLADAARSALAGSVEGLGVCLWCGSQAVSVSAWSPGAEVTVHCAECGSDLVGSADLGVASGRSAAHSGQLSVREGVA